MSNINNSNIFAGERSYKTNFFLQFLSPQTEQKFREESFIRNRFSLQGFISLTICYLAINFMQTDCFIFAHSCDHIFLLVFSMLTLISALISLQFRIYPMIAQISLIPTTLYLYVVFLERYRYEAAVMLMTLYTTLASFLVCPVWFLQLIYSFGVHVLFLIYLHLYSAQYLIRNAEAETILDLTIYTIVAIVFLAFIEKDRKEKWVLLDTFKKSERIFRKIYEELPYPMFIIDKSKRILFTNRQGIGLLSNYTKNCNSCDLRNRNVYFNNTVDEKYIKDLEDAISVATSHLKSTTCFISLKEPLETLSENLENRIKKNNYYKTIVNPVLWKKSMANMVSLRDYSTKKQSEIVNDKTISGLIKEVEDIIKKCESYAVENENNKSKIDLLAQSNLLKNSILNTKILFNQIFEKKEGLKEETNFNIQKVILASIATLKPILQQSKCDLLLKFEASFPNSVHGDELLFEQIFFNTLSMLIQNVHQNKLIVDCKLSSVLQDGKLLLSFDFLIPSDNQNISDTIQNNLRVAKISSLDHFINTDKILFALALIQPGIEVFGGKCELEENIYSALNCKSLLITLPFKSHDSSKQTNPSLFTTFESTNYNSSSKTGTFAYEWKWEDLQKSDNTALIPSAQKSLINSPNTNESKRVEGPHTRHMRAHSSDRANNLEYLKDQQKNKFIEGLRKLKTDAAKNFGNVSSSISQSNPSNTSQSLSSFLVAEKLDEIPSAKRLKNQQEEETDNEKELRNEHHREKSKKEAPAIILNKADQKEPALEKLWQNEPVEDLAKIYEKNEWKLKMAIGHALMNLFDRYKISKERQKQNDEEESVSVLDAITFQDRMKAQGINEQNLYEKTIKYLSSKLENETTKENFLQFVEHYIEDLRREIEGIQERGLIIMPQMKHSFNNSAGSGEQLNPFNRQVSPVTVMRRAATSQNRDLIKALKFLRKNSNDSHLDIDSDRSKERSLNGRLLLSPSVSQSMSLKGRKKTKEDVPFDQVDLQSSKKEEEKKAEIEEQKLENFRKAVLPFQSELFPISLAKRIETHKKRWISVNAMINSQSEKSFNYNEEFTVLAVDDSDFVFKGLTNLPLKYKIKFDFAKNGTEALKKYLYNVEQGMLYHFILMDLQMPVMDGFETARNIREEETNKKYPQTYICAMSAFDEPEFANRAKREGMNNFCQKPLRTEVLHNLIKTRCEEMKIPLPPLPE